jgi:hypothetical protein
VADGDPIRPRPDRRFAAERVQARDDLDQHLLGGVLRVGGVRRHSECEPVDIVLNRAHDAVERVGIASLGEGHEVREAVDIERP